MSKGEMTREKFIAMLEAKGAEGGNGIYNWYAVSFSTRILSNAVLVFTGRGGDDCFFPYDKIENVTLCRGIKKGIVFMRVDGETSLFGYRWK